MRTYNGQITELKENEWFVFGSNTQGRHGKGSALVAVRNFGAIYGQPIGPQGKSYAIVTKDLGKKIHPSIHPTSVVFQIKILYEFAKNKPDDLFYVVYSGIGTNLNWWTPSQMAQMFSSFPIPENIVFEEEFAKLLNLKS